MSSKDIEIFVPCECGTEAIQITYFHEVGFEPVVYMNFWEMMPSRLTLWRRLKYAFSILFAGESLYPEIIIRKEGMMKIIETLTKAIVVCEMDCK